MNEILLKLDDPAVFSTVDYNGDGGGWTYLLTLKDLAFGEARESDAVDLNDFVVPASRFRTEFARTALIMWHAPGPSVGSVDVYWAASIAGNEFPGGVTGADGAYTGTDGSTLKESLKQLQLLGKLPMTPTDDDPIVQQKTFRAVLPSRYGSIVVVNSSDVDLSLAGTKSAIVLTPIVVEVQ